MTAYPLSANVYDSLGEAYMDAGDTTRAIANYRRSLRLNPANHNAADALRELGRREEGQGRSLRESLGRRLAPPEPLGSLRPWTQLKAKPLKSIRYHCAWSRPVPLGATIGSVSV